MEIKVQNSQKISPAISLSKIVDGKTLSSSESEELFVDLFSGNLSEIELSALIVAMRMRGEKSEEIMGAAKSMRAFSQRLTLDNNEIFDTCGTGGDNSHSFNISSSVAIILAAYGIPVAKHGNRSMSSKSGSTDFYEALGIPVNLTGQEAVAYFKNHNFLYMAAPNYHPAMKFAAPVRKKLQIRTIFNYLGPLANPAGTMRQAIGFFSHELLPVYAEAVRALDFERAIVYSSLDGMDEISPYEPTLLYEIEGDRSEKKLFSPEKFISKEEALQIPKGLSAEENARLFEEIISCGHETPLAKLLAMNSAVAMFAHNPQNDISTSFGKALELIISGEVLKKLKCLRELKNVC